MSDTNHGTRAVCHATGAVATHLCISAASGAPSLRVVGLRRMLGGTAATFAILSLPIACTEANTVEGTARDAAVVEQVVRQLAGDPPDPEELPTVFVTGAEGTIAIEVQAGVAAALVDEIDVRFADERIEAIDEGIEGRPVRDDGVLLVLYRVPEQDRRIDVRVDRYEAFDLGRRLIVSLRYAEPDWIVTETVELEPTDP